MKQGYRVIVPDMLGCGGTDKPAEVEAYPMGKLSNDLAALLDALEIPKAVSVVRDWAQCDGQAECNVRSS